MEQPPGTGFGERLKAAVKKKGVRQIDLINHFEEVASTQPFQEADLTQPLQEAEISISKNTIKALYKAKKPTTQFASVIAIAEFLEVSIDYLAGRTEDMLVHIKSDEPISDEQECIKSSKEKILESICLLMQNDMFIIRTNTNIGEQTDSLIMETNNGILTDFAAKALPNIENESALKSIVDKTETFVFNNVCYSEIEYITALVAEYIREVNPHDERLRLDCPEPTDEFLKFDEDFTHFSVLESKDGYCYDEINEGGIEFLENHFKIPQVDRMSEKNECSDICTVQQP